MNPWNVDLFRRRYMRAGFLLLGVTGLAGRTSAQSTISLGDSVSRNVAGHAIDRVIVPLADGDYASFAVTHPKGLAVTVVGPNGSLVRSFIEPDMHGINATAFVAEGAGQYAVTVKNDGDAGAQYSIVFRKRLSLDERTRAVAPPDAASSSRMESIRRQVDSGNTSTASFWDAVAKEGTPLFEPLDPNYELVTFLWRAVGDTRNVYVAASLELPGEPNKAMRQLGNTDIWYLTLKVPKGARFTYGLEPNRPSVDGLERVTRQMDLFNRGMKWNCAGGASKYTCRSVGESPQATPQPWIAKRAGAATGRIEKKKIHSTVQNVDRDLTIYTPAGYEPKGKPTSLVVLFDGDDYLEPEWSGLNTWDNLIAAGKIPPTIVVMVHNLPGRRLFDLVANPAFADFVAKELAVWIRSHYNVSPDQSKVVIGGASAGGLGATYIGLTHPEVFGNVLSMSGAFWWSPAHNGGVCGGSCAGPSARPAVRNRDATTEPNFLADLVLNKTPAGRVRVYLGVGTFEFDSDGTGGGILEETRHLRDLLLARNYQVTFKQFVGGHDNVIWRGGLGDGLETLLGEKTPLR
jgi:enterochelin esterase family protein